MLYVAIIATFVYAMLLLAFWSLKKDSPDGSKERRSGRVGFAIISWTGAVIYGIPALCAAAFAWFCLCGGHTAIAELTTVGDRILFASVLLLPPAMLLAYAICSLASRRTKQLPQ